MPQNKRNGARASLWIALLAAAACTSGCASPGMTGSGGKANSGGTSGTGGSSSGTGGMSSASGGTAGNTRPVQTCVPPANVDSPVAKLSQTGCMDAKNPTLFAASVVPYEVNSPLWSDAADKSRGIAIPNGKSIHVKDCAAEPALCPQGPADTGKWVFPVGTVAVKNFMFDGKFVETRLFIRFDDKTWGGFSYQWNEAQTDATIVPDDRLTVSFNTGKRVVEWRYPNRIDCTKCHSPSSGSILGPETPQMNRVVGGMNQMDRFAALGLFDAPVAKPYQAALIAPVASQAGTPPASATLEQRARSYLHANCAICHRPDGEFGDLDLRYDVAFKDTHLCGTMPARGSFDAANLNLDPGKPQNSVAWLRMNTLPDPAGGKTLRMPQIGTAVIDADALKLIGDWISSIKTCPM